MSERPNIEAGDGVLGDGAASPPHQLGGLGSAVSSPGRGRDSPAANAFLATKSTENARSGYKFREFYCTNFHSQNHKLTGVNAKVDPNVTD